MVGAWIGPDRERNEQELAKLIDLAKKGLVGIAGIGNEVLLRGELTKDEVIGYIKRFKEAVPDVPVGCVDTYYQFTNYPDLVEACDVLMINCYPFWEGCSVEQASYYLHEMFESVKRVSQGKKIIVTETGWPDGGNKTINAIPSPINAMKYFINVDNWRKKQDIELFYFSSFDESWKVHHEGDVGQRWGIWDKNEKSKYA
jgi:GPH family glycoside/pentoside/hexuronide:cation symporter